MIWLWFVVVQMIQLFGTIVGWFLLIPFCLLQAWNTNAISIKDGRKIDSWKFSWLNFIYGNPEDGVSGQQAIIWPNGVPSEYLPGAWAPYRAYMWSCLRNSCDSLKYKFAKENGPLKNIQIGPYIVKLGWQPENGFNVPVLSIRKTV